jgi:non-canonical purine NTP pyrophosphatase (RdgB/HAM1 family)
MTNVTFMTGNQHKADYLQRLLGVEIAHKKVDLDELQSTDLHEIIEHKVRQAHAIIGAPVLVEDVSLEFKALGNLPGPFIKFFVESRDGLEHLCRMLDGLDERRASAKCTFGYFDGRNVVFFDGELAGEIAMHPRGENGFGWDKIFCPEGYGGRTRAELSVEEDETTYQTIKPFAQLKDFIKNGYTN